MAIHRKGGHESEYADYVTKLDEGDYLSFVHVGKGQNPRVIARQLTVDMSGDAGYHTWVAQPSGSHLITVELNEDNITDKMVRKFVDNFKLEQLKILGGTAANYFGSITLGDRLYMTNGLSSSYDAADWALWLAGRSFPINQMGNKITKFLTALMNEGWTDLSALAMVAYHDWNYKSDALKKFWTHLFGHDNYDPRLHDVNFIYEFIENNSDLYWDNSVKMI